MDVAYNKKAKEEILFWRDSGNKKIQGKISDLIEEIKNTPFEGIGKPEPLKYNLTGKWYKRINSEHRLIYTFERNTIYIYSLKEHYE
jgi:toxin YoeB